MGAFQRALQNLITAYKGLDLFRLVTYDAGALSKDNADAVRRGASAVPAAAGGAACRDASGAQEDRSAAGALEQTQKSEAELVGPEIRAQLAHKIHAARPQ